MCTVYVSQYGWVNPEVGQSVKVVTFYIVIDITLAESANTANVYSFDLE